MDTIDSEPGTDIPEVESNDSPDIQDPPALAERLAVAGTVVDGD